MDGDAKCVCFRVSSRLQHPTLLGLGLVAALALFFLELISTTVALPDPAHAFLAGLPTATPTVSPVAPSSPGSVSRAPTPTSSLAPLATHQPTPTSLPSLTVSATASPVITATRAMTQTATLQPATSSTGTLVASWMHTLTPTPTFTDTLLSTWTPTPIPTATLTGTPRARGSGLFLVPVQDAWIDEAEPDANHGSDRLLRLSGASGKRRRILIQFDLGAIPADSPVARASLRLMQAGTLSGISLGVHRIEEAWQETEVSWVQRMAGHPWRTGGGDFTPTSEHSLTLQVDGPREIDLTGLVRTWIAGQLANHGLILEVQGGAGEVTFASREQGGLPGSARGEDLGPGRRAAEVYAGPSLHIEFGAEFPIPTPTPTPTRVFIPGPGPVPRPTFAPPGHSDSGRYSSRTATCAMCHRAHSSLGQALRTTASEEALCMTCHDGTGASANIQSQFARPFRHPVDATAGVHDTSERSPDRFRGDNRHVECEDCHEPHLTARGSHTPGGNWAGGPLQSTWGISVTNGPAGTLPRYSIVEAVTFEYQVCFKCHSAWSSVGRGTDTSRGFNPNNYGYHPVEAVGKNQPGSANPAFAGTFRAPWGPNSLVQCGDCHGGGPTEPEGVHGSNQRWILRVNETGVGTAAVFCYNCHSRDTYGDAGYTNPPNRSWSRWNHPYTSRHTELTFSRYRNPYGIWCLNCHGGDVLGGLHGSNKGVGPVGTTALGKRLMNGGGVVGWTAAPNVSTEGICWAVCHGAPYAPETYKANYTYPP